MQVFGEWRYSFIIYVVMQMWSHLWHIVKKKIGLNPNVILATYAIVKSRQKLFSCCMTFAYEYSKCFTLMKLVSS